MTSASVDSRAARKAATRSAIADALLDLLAGGRLRPTAREIASQAGISLRSVYVHFDDLEDLFCVAARRQFDRVGPLLAPVADTGPLRARAESVVHRRAQLFAQFGAIRHATELQAPFSPTLQRLVDNAHARSRQELEQVFGTELAALDPATRARTVATIDTLSTGSSWDLMRERHGLSAEEAERTMVDAIVACLETPA